MSAEMIQALESRLLLTDSATNPDADGKLTIAGTESNDSITVHTVKRSKVSFIQVVVAANHETSAQLYKPGNVTQIEIKAGGGNDVVNIEVGGIQTVINGGSGNDALIGGKRFAFRWGRQR
jgi:Ca2+-binding RTX toxin-like protein